MNVAGPMASAALGTEFLFCDDRGMAGVAAELRVTVEQFEVTVPRVVERNRLPRRGAVALLAGGAEARRVCIVRAVAAGAVAGEGILEVRCLVASLAVELRVRTVTVTGWPTARTSSPSPPGGRSPC